MLNFSDEKKVDVLIVELRERYGASHKMRERSMKFTLWISGMAIGLTWLLISHQTLNIFQRISLSALILVLFGGALYFILGLRKGFQSNRSTMIRVEKALRMYDDGIYLENKPLLPNKYSKTERQWSDHFTSLVIWLVITSIPLFVLTWTCAGTIQKHQPKIQIESTQKGGHDIG